MPDLAPDIRLALELLDDDVAPAPAALAANNGLPIDLVALGLVVLS